jgi:hypothetical protein
MDYKGHAFQKIRSLVKEISIDPDLTDNQKNLKYIYDDNKYPLKSDKWDGPKIFSEMRNAIVHDREERDYRPSLNTVPKEAREEALELGLWYLELCILKRLDYTGQYLNRFDLKHEKVPWG